MALVDFYQLAVLHNLSRHAGVLSDPSHPPSMSPPTPSSSRLPLVESDRPNPLFPLPTQPVPKTPQRNRDATRSIPNLTPKARGSALLQKLIRAAEQPKKLDSAKYEEYIVQDFERHRVFVDIDVFMKHVLHVPENWKGLWGRTIRRIKREQKFLDSHFKYSSECNIQDGPESRFYQPLVDMANAILDFPTKYLPGESAKPWTPQRYLRNDPRRVLGGVINNLSPDIVAVHNKFLPTGGAGELDEWYLKGSNLTWAQPLQALEVKASDGALVDGSCMPRLKVNGEHATAVAMTFCDRGYRARSAEEPCIPSDAVPGLDKRYNRRASCRQRGMLGSTRSSTPKAACR